MLDLSAYTSTALDSTVLDGNHARQRLCFGCTLRELMVTRHHASSSAFQVYCLTPAIASKLIGSVLISLARGLGGKTYQLPVSRGWLLPARYSSRAVVIITDPSVMVILTEGVSSFWDPDLFGGVEHRFSFCTVCCCFEASLMAETSIEPVEDDDRDARAAERVGDVWQRRPLSRLSLGCDEEE